MNTKKIVFTVFASSPFLLVALFIVAEYNPQVRQAFDDLPTAGEVAFITFFLVAWLACIWDIWRNSRMPAEKRKLWTAVLALGNWYALPFYWWFYIRGGNHDETVDDHKI